MPKLTPNWFEGKTALIMSDASPDVTQAFGEALAWRGMHLLLVADGEQEGLHAWAARLSRVYAVHVEVLQNLHTVGATQQMYATLQQCGRHVDLLLTSKADESDAPLHNQLPLETGALTTASGMLLHTVLPRMVLRGRGIIIQIANQGVPLPLPPLSLATAMLLSCSRPLWTDGHVCMSRALTLVPSCSSSPLQVVFARHVVVLRARLASPEHVAEGVLRAVTRGHSSIVLGLLQILLRRVRLAAARGTDRLSKHAASKNSGTLLIHHR